MFDEVTKQEGGKRAVRRGAYLVGSTAVQIVLVFAVITVSARTGVKVIAVKIVDVKFIRQAPPPPPLPAPKRASKPKTDAPKQVVPPMAMIQPKDVPVELKPPDPNEKVEEESASDEGVEGGVVGGVAGAQGLAQGLDEAPHYATSGFRKPQEVQPGCVRSSMRVPLSLAGFISGLITVKFAIRRDGSIGEVQIVSQVADPRITEVIRQGLSSCQWSPGADAQGRPVSIWVIMPIRFASG